MEDDKEGGDGEGQSEWVLGQECILSGIGAEKGVWAPMSLV
jgi:hypothetical protein